ncbi:unnamed protein product [Clonostachys rhizophaga]|uniref:Enoyl reductase (ER) domain-containing protein n=1 Tax=Clonostachys rhizophaga TaxID=160324 RepID=A0A9N9YDA4_9HYPO|nr:unnamed protein product [Clonostachys rhizophaga]
MAHSSPSSDLPDTMKVWRFHSVAGGAEKNMRLETMEIPDPKPTKSTLVKMVAASLNPIDIKASEIPVLGSCIHRLPAIPGCDGVGRVIETYEPSLSKGMMVQFRKNEMQPDGVFAEYVLLPPGQCAVIPDGVPTTQAVTVGTCGVTGYQALAPYILDKDGQPKKHGHTPRVFINGGSGGTGVFQIQLAKIFGWHVVTTCSASNIELCKSLGADEVIDYRKEPAEEVLKRMVLEDSSKGFDLVVDNNSNPWPLFKAADVYLRSEGTYVQIGADFAVDSARHFFNINLRPKFLGGARSKWTFMGMKTSREDSERILEWMAAGKIHIPIDSEFPFEKVPDAYSKLKSGAKGGKIVVHFSE